jgi:Ca2+-binding EF-hand superfamily protein
MGNQVIFYWTLVARHLSRSFDINPNLRPPAMPLPISFKKQNHQISLSDAQENQIKEIFALFDTDGGGSIDRKELEFAMTALGFQSQDTEIMQQKGKKSLAAGSTSNLLDYIVGDGKVTLTEFIGLMTGEVLGHNQNEEAQAVFAVLCRSDGESKHDNLVTPSKLEAVCREFKVVFSQEKLVIILLFLVLDLLGLFLFLFLVAHYVP